jgi:oleate hydratase
MSGELATDSTSVYLVGGGIASLAAAAFLIRDGNIPGKNITILEASPKIGGSLDAGNSRDGYVMRGGRMFESRYVCTFDLFSSIPTLDGSKTVTQEIFQWNEVLKTSSQSRLFRDGHRVDAPKFSLTPRHILTLERIALQPEEALGRSSIGDQFDPSFFETDFWIMWCTTFAFQPWHSAAEFKRYLNRFTHMISGFSKLNGILRTVYNQYDSLVRPLEKWLLERGVKFQFNTCVLDLEFHDGSDGYWVRRIHCGRHGGECDIEVSERDLVIVTLGSMVEGSSLGSMGSAPEIRSKSHAGGWRLWERLAVGNHQFGCPDVFTEHVEQSKWVSFTTTLYDPTLFQLVADRTGNVPGEGGLITFPESRWLASIVLPHQPHFIGQPPDVQVLWGDGLSDDVDGNFVDKPMQDCTGRDIMTEILGHLRIEDQAKKILDSCICIPCRMPYITSQFSCRSKGDRPDVVPPGSRNLAFIGQFCELAEDVVFTVEYSIRSAQTAAYSLLDLNRTPPPVYRGQDNLRVLFQAVETLHDRQHA